MHSRERVKRAIHFRDPDRPPISHAILPATQLKYGAALDDILDGVHEDFGWHLLPDMAPEDYPPLYKQGRHYDDFGVLWDVEDAGICGIPVAWPLADWANYPTYVWPQFSAGPPKTRLYSGHMAGYDDAYYARGGWITFFEILQQLRGMENLLMDLASPEPEIYQLRDDLLAFNLAWIDQWLAYEYDGLHFADDWGSQTGLLIAPACWRAFFKPVYQAMFAKVRAAGRDVHFHSDGQIVDIIPDLIDLGVSVLNCQASVVGLATLKRDFAGHVCFRTDLDRQHVVPTGTPAQISTHVHTVFAHLGTPHGGLIACGEIGPDTPLENIRAMYQAFMAYGG